MIENKIINKNSGITNTDEISKIDNTSEVNTEKNEITDMNNYLNTNIPEVQCANKVHITIQEFINNMQYTNYTVKSGDTLTDIANRYSSTCTLSASLKLIKTANNIKSSSSLQSGINLKIPEQILKNGITHKISSGDTWSKICNEYYPLYDLDYIMPLLIFINNFNDTTLPLGEHIYLPQI